MFFNFSTGKESKRLERTKSNVNEKDLENIRNNKEDLSKLKRKVVIKKDSQLSINTFNKEINKKELKKRSPKRNRCSL